MIHPQSKCAYFVQGKAYYYDSRENERLSDFQVMTTTQIMNCGSRTFFHKTE